MSVPRSRLWAFAFLVLATQSAASADNGDAEEGLTTETAPPEKILSRHRRYLVFPEGSTFTGAFCVTAKTYVIKDTEIYTMGAAWGISYDLPNNSREVASIGAGIGSDDLRRKAHQAHQGRQGRRDRRDLYRKIEIAVNSNGLDGRSCVLRAICDARDLPGEKDKTPKSLPLEILRTILNVPIDSLAPHEPYEHHEYALARRLGIEGEDCEKHFPNCPFSPLSRITSWVPAPIWDFD